MVATPKTLWVTLARPLPPDAPRVNLRSTENLHPCLENSPARARAVCACERTKFRLSFVCVVCFIPPRSGTL